MHNLTRLKIKPLCFFFDILTRVCMNMHVRALTWAWQHTCCCCFLFALQHPLSGHMKPHYIRNPTANPSANVVNSCPSHRQAAPNYRALVQHRHIIISVVSHLWQLPTVICLSAVPALSYWSRETVGNWNHTGVPPLWLNTVCKETQFVFRAHYSDQGETEQVFRHWKSSFPKQPIIHFVDCENAIMWCPSFSVCVSVFVHICSGTGKCLVTRHFLLYQGWIFCLYPQPGGRCFTSHAAHICLVRRPLSRGLGSLVAFCHSSGCLSVIDVVSDGWPRAFLITLLLHVLQSHPSH